MDSACVAAAEEKQLAVIKRLLPHPILQEKTVFLFGTVGDAVTGTFATTAAVLIDNRVAVLRINGEGLCRSLPAASLP